MFRFTEHSTYTHLELVSSYRLQNAKFATLHRVAAQKVNANFRAEWSYYFSGFFTIVFLHLGQCRST